MKKVLFLVALLCVIGFVSQAFAGLIVDETLRPFDMRAHSEVVFPELEELTHLNKQLESIRDMLFTGFCWLVIYALIALFFLYKISERLKN